MCDVFVIQWDSLHPGLVAKRVAYLPLSGGPLLKGMMMTMREKRAQQQITDYRLQIMASHHPCSVLHQTLSQLPTARKTTQACLFSLFRQNVVAAGERATTMLRPKINLTVLRGL